MANEDPLVEKVKQFLKEALDDDRGIHLSDHEAERLIDMIERDQIHLENIGIAPYIRRIEHNPREKAFAEMWLKWNKPQAGVDQGYGILQNLFIDDNPKTSGLTKIWHEVMNTRDRRIVATVIQWLGTNVGIGFLTEALEAGGQYRLQAIPRKYEEPTTPGQA